MMPRVLSRRAASAYPASMAMLPDISPSGPARWAQFSVMAEAPPAEAPAPTPPPAATSERRGWHGVLGVEEEMTGDARWIDAGALRWENLPLPLRYAGKDVGGHDGAEVCGAITEIERRGKLILGRGWLDAVSDLGREVIRRVAAGMNSGVSMDLDDVSFELRVAPELLGDPEDPMDGDEDEAGLMPAGKGKGQGKGTDDEEVPEPDEAGRVPVITVKSDEEVRATTSGRIRAATLVAIPAFAQARIELDPEDEAAPAPAEGEDTSTGTGEGEAGSASAATVIVASAAVPDNPPEAWFQNPGLAEVTPLVVTDDGRVYGHLATWGTCHTGHAHRGCITPPPSPSGYAYFRTGAVRTAEGTEVGVGHLTLETVHAPNEMTASQALAHYENTGRVVADLVAGEDSFGIWVSGALRPGTTAKQVRSLRAAPLSGDWRTYGGHLELVAVLAVNVPGFPIPRPAGFVSKGTLQTIVASGMVPPRQVRRPGLPGAFSAEDLKYLKRLAERERAAERVQLDSTAEALAIRVHTTRLARLRKTFTLT